MSRRFGILAVLGALFLVTGDARAQAPAGMEETVRPATTSIYGDTGLWFVPTGEVLRDGTWSASGYRVNWDVRQGFTDISHFEGTFAFGVKNRAEIFGAVRFITRIDRDTRPIFGFGGDRYGGVDNNYPFVREGWIGNEFGDTFLGAKINLLSESRQSPVALAVRGMVKVPTGSAERRIRHRQDGRRVRLSFSARKSRAWSKSPATSATCIAAIRTNSILSNGMRFGIGAQFPTRSPLKFTTEWFGERYFEDVVTRLGVSRDGVGDRRGRQHSARHVAASPAVHADVRRDLADAATDSSPAPASTGRPRPKIAKISGSTATTTSARSSAGSSASAITRAWPDGRFRCRHHHRRRRRRRGAQHTLTVDAQCNPCTVEVGATSNVTATAKDSIGCVITYRWSAPTGTFANPAQQNTVWTAPNTPGTVPVTVTGTCPSDNMSASDTVNIQVVPRAVKTITFEDVYFDFDRFSLTDAAQRILAQAVEAMRADPTLRFGSKATPATSARPNTTSRSAIAARARCSSTSSSNGIAADRLTTVSFGEEQPKHDNSREETRRLNRRAAMTVQLVAGGN